MSTRSYVVKISVGGTSSAKIWNPEKPLQVGHPFRWVLEHTASGVKIRNVSPEAQASKVELACLVKHEQIDKKATVELPEVAGVKSAFTVELQPVVSLPAAFETHPERGLGLRVYACRGAWTLGCETIEGKYQGRIDGKKIFTISQTGQGAAARYEIRSHVMALELRVVERLEPLDKRALARGGKKAESLAQGKPQNFEGSALAGATLAHGIYQWHLDVLNPASGEVLPPVAFEAEAQREAAALKKGLVSSLSAMAALFLLAVLWPKPDAPLPTEPVKTKILFTKHKPKTVHGLMTAAPKGDRHSKDFSIGSRGSAKHSGRKGSQGSQHDFAKAAPKAHTLPNVTKPMAQAKPAKAPTHATHHAAAKAPSHQTTHKASPSLKPKAASVAKSAAPKAKALPSSALAQALKGSELKNASRGLLAGGMTQLLAQSKFASGSDSRAEARGMMSAGSSLGGAGVPSNGRVGTGSVAISGFGGGGGAGGDGDGGPGSAGAGYGKGSYAKVSGQGRSFVSLDTGASEVSDGLTMDQVGRVIHRHMNEIRYCYEAAILRNPQLEGKLPLHFTVGASGSVKSASGRMAQDASLGQCIAQRLSTWKFPQPVGGVNVAITYPFIFKPLGH